jgi:4'-phosphopantetheinyl transferase EntD
VKEDNRAMMISEVLTSDIAASEQLGLLSGTLWDKEVEALGHSVSKRQVEFAAGRTCARNALEALGVPGQAILRGEGREPLWPAGIVGSITHCNGYCAAAVGRDNEMVSIGIDAEQNEPLPDGVLEMIARKEEMLSLDRLSFAHVNWDRLLFSAKESVYKAWYPIMKRWLGFEEARISIEASTSTFRVQFLERNSRSLTVSDAHFTGRYIALQGYILTSVVVCRSR